MDPLAFGQLREAFEDLLATPEARREIRVEEIAARDPQLANELRAMLAAYASQSSLLDRPLIDPHEIDASSPSLPAAPAPGSMFGSYRLEKELGRGGMGVVYRAGRADGSFQKLVAIKILRRDRIDDLFLRRFQQERRILAQLNHPHIAAIVDAGTSAEGDPYFVMEYVDGVPITAYCRAHALTVRQKLELFLQICDAVQEAHRNLTVHRDLKPSNVLVTESGAVKLLDFGIAKLLEPGPEAADAPPTIAVLTPEYSSPEQIANQPITTATDVFSLGVLLYELLAGVHPFRAGPDSKTRLAHEVMQAIAEEDPPPLSARAAAVDAKQLRGELDAIAATALRKQPAWRYPSVEQLADDISRYLRGLPVLARGDRLAYRVRKFVRRQWLPVTAAALVTLVLIAGIVATRIQARAAEEARAAAELARQHAEDERRIAERNQHTADEQRAIAEARTREAEAERLKERERYRDVRSLSSSLLFDVYDGVRDLAGSATARRVIVARVQRQLESLSADSQNDPSLLRDLAASYERMGELRTDPHHPNKTDAAAALEAYRHGVDLRRQIASASRAPADRRDLALSLAKLGDGQVLTGDMKIAVASYTDARSMATSLLRSQPADPALLRALGAIDMRRGSALLATGDNNGSMEACREGIETLSPLAAQAPADVELQRLLATTQASYANALRMSRGGAEAAKQAKLAVESLHRLELLAPTNSEYRRLSSTAGMILAASLAASGDEAGSLEAFRQSVRSMEIAIEIDPSDLGSPLRLAVTLMAYSRRLSSAGKRDAAHDAAQEALGLLRRTSENPSAGPVEWNEYADALLKADWPDLTQPARALDLATNAVAATHRTNPFFLDTLAWAYFRTGDAPKAAETERAALQLMPAGAKGGLHDELERGLETFVHSGPAPAKF